MADFSLQELLSPIDFEHLIRDLLSKELSVELTAFAEGADQGVDLRYSKGASREDIVVQCKRQKSISREVLLEEKKKMEELVVSEYYLATSGDLSKRKTDFILDTFSEWMSDDSSIFSKSRINQLLEVHPDILRQHYKLWINSSSIFQSLVNSSLIERASFLITNLKENYKYYVKGESFIEANEILSEHGFLVISGAPGIGKTTLAKMLLWEYLHKGYEVVQMTDISEGEAFLSSSSDTKQAYYFDDFLGENFLEYDVLKGRSGDLMNFIDRVIKGKNKVLILTTREYILNQAKDRYERFDQHDFDIGKYILDLDKYTESIKALILYNHLFYSGVSMSHIQALIESKAYAEILSHKNYNPRLIEGMTTRLKDTSAENYPSEFLENLDNPFGIWDKAFSSQISQGAQAMLFVLLSLDGQMTKAKLREAFKVFVSHPQSQYQVAIKDFERCAREIDGSFIGTSSTKREEILFRFHDPSVKDFLHNLIHDNQDVLIQLVDSAVYLLQLDTLIKITEAKWGGNKDIFAALSKKVYEIDTLLDAPKIYSSGFVFQQRKTEIDRIDVAEKLFLIGSSRDLKDYLVAKIEGIDVNKLSSHDFMKYLILIRKYKSVLRIQEESVISKALSSLNSLVDINNLIRVLTVFPTKMKRKLSEKQEDVEEAVSSTMNSALNSVEDVYDYNNLESCTQKLEETQDLHGTDMFPQLSFFKDSLDDLYEEILLKDADETPTDHEEELEDIEVEEIDIHKLFRIENFER